MNIPSFVGPLGCALLFLLTIFGICFYYCYVKPKRQNRNNRGTGNSEAKTGNNGATNRPKYSYHDDEFYYGLPTMSYSAGYFAYGGFPVVVSESHESRWTYPTKPEASSRIENTKHSTVTTVSKIQNESKRRQFSPRTDISRQLSVENRVRSASQLQVIQECEEEEDNSETNRKGENEEKHDGKKVEAKHALT